MIILGILAQLLFKNQANSGKLINISSPEILRKPYVFWWFRGEQKLICLNLFNIKSEIRRLSLSLVVCEIWEGWPSGLPIWEPIWNFPTETPLGAWPSLGTQPRYEVPGNLWDEIWEAQWLTR